MLKLKLLLKLMLTSSCLLIFNFPTHLAFQVSPRFLKWVLDSTYVFLISMAFRDAFALSNYIFRIFDAVVHFGYKTLVMAVAVYQYQSIN